jgi:hypothetical protein
MENNKHFYVRLNEESTSAMLQRHYGSFFRSVDDAMTFAEKYLGKGNTVQVVDQNGKVYVSTGLLASET